MRRKFAKPGIFANHVIYGASWNKSSNPTLTRTDGAVGMVASVGVDMQIVRNDFDAAPIFGEIHDVTDTLGNVFVRIPKFYIRKTDSTNLKTWQISKTKYDEFYLPWCFWDFANNSELPYVDVGKHMASLGTGNKLESKPGKQPLASKSIVDFRTYARNNNVSGLSGYQQHDIHVIDILRTLMFIEFATLDMQTIMQGNSLTSSAWVTGFSSSIAASSGSIVSNNDGKHPCVYRGIESPFGDIYQFVDGVNINARRAWVCKNAAQYASNVFASPYEQLRYIDGATSGYINAMGFDTNFQFAELPIEANGSNTTYYADYYYQSAGTCIAFFGGAWDGGSDGGPSFWNLSNASSLVSTRIGGRLVRKAL